MLEKEEQENKNITKAFAMAEIEIEKAFPVGTIREWKGKKFIKSPDKKWRPYYESHDMRGEKLALAALAKKINTLQDGDYEGLYKLLTLHRSRFVSDKSLIKDLYNAMKERGALGSGRFTKTEKVEVKTEAKKEIKEEKKVEAKEKKKTEKKNKKEKDPRFQKITREYLEGFEHVFENVLFFRGEKTSLGVEISPGYIMGDIPVYSPYDSYGFNKIINQYLNRNGIYEEADLTDDKVLKCHALLELATETAMNGKSIDSKISNRKLYEKNGVIIMAEKRGKDDWVLRGVDINTNKEQAEKAIQERIDYIKNMPSRKNLTKGVHDFMRVVLNVSMKRLGCFESVFKAKELENVKCIVPKRLKEPLSEEKIIENLAFDDNKKNGEGGYCLSLALLYIAAKNGFDVLDKKGENSRGYFSRVGIDIIEDVLDVDTRIVNDYAESSVNAVNIVKTIGKEDYGKEYLLCAGQHASIIRKVDDGTENGKLQYLELQSGNYMDKWHIVSTKYTKEFFNLRFGCEDADKEGTDPIAQMFDIDEISEKLKNKKYYNDFSKLLGYLNTKE